MIRTFIRVYVCLGALKQGFRACGREILRLDGRFMSGPWPGQILIAVGVDANNRIYPVAYPIVEVESKASWCWFLNLLGEDLGIEANFNYTFISDWQRGLIQAIASMFPCAEHRYYVRHLHENMKSQFKEGVYKEMIWNAAKATSIGEFNKNMVELKSYNFDAYDWEMWQVVKATTVIVPPLYKPQVDRPPKKRKKSYDEIANESCSSGKLSRKGKSGGERRTAGARNVFGQASNKAHQLVQGMPQVNLVQDQAQQAKDQLNIVHDQDKVFRHQDQVNFADVDSVMQSLLRGCDEFIHEGSFDVVLRVFLYGLCYGKIRHCLFMRKSTRFDIDMGFPLCDAEAILHPCLGEVAIWLQPWWALDTISDVAAILYLRFGEVAIWSQPWRLSDITSDVAGLSVFIKPSEHEGTNVSKPSGEDTPVLRMRGLPFSAEKEDIVDFFKEFTLSEDSIHITYNSEGRATREAFYRYLITITLHIIHALAIATDIVTLDWNEQIVEFLYTLFSSFILIYYSSNSVYLSSDILDGSHDNTDGNTPRPKDATDAAIDATLNPCDENGEEDAGS
nr:transposase, mutator type [Tanacetum cinerariifolium]